MSKRLFNAQAIPTEQQVTGSPDFTDDNIMPGNNPYVMRGRMATGGRSGVWSIVNLTDYKYDQDSDGDWADTNNPNQSILYNSTSTIGVDENGMVIANKYYDNADGAYITYVKEMTVNLNDIDVINAPITGVDVWFRWMPPEAFNKYLWNEGGDIYDTLETGYNCPREVPCGSWQTETWIPNEWKFVGTRYSTSFSVTIPMPAEYREWEGIWEEEPNKPGTAVGRQQYVDANFPETWFQFLVTGHSTWKPDKYNYRWIGDTDRFGESSFVNTSAWDDNKRYWSIGNTGGALGGYKVGDSFISHNDSGDILNRTAVGYLPWNPHYGASQQNVWETYRRQRTTFGDVAIFAPRRWRKWFGV